MAHRGDHRAVAILGLGGMGKTTLAASTARRLTEHFDAVIWRSLINAPTLEELLRPLLQHVQRTQGYAHAPVSVDEQLAHFCSYLQANRVLLVLDNMETILDEANAGRFRAGYESYGQLIRQMIQRPHKSRLLFTSRERPNEFHRLEMDQATIHSLRLDGLDAAATSQILQQRGIHAAPDDEAALRQRYSGNPLALKLVADTVKEIFDGDIELFLTEEVLVFDDVRTVLDQQFDRLSPLEEDILLWLTVARTPLAAQELRSRLLQAPSQRALLEAIGALQRRSLIERRAHGFHLQNVVADYLTSLLIDQICAEIERGEIVRLHSHGLINAHADDDVRQSQVRLLLRPVAELTATRLGPAALVENLRDMLATLRMTAQRSPSYAGGNLLNLLLHESSPITGLDASKIAIWHAYLRGVQLSDADFQEADLAHSVFNDTFGAVYSVAISPDGQLFAAGTADGEVRLWRMVDGQPLSIITGHHDSVWSIAFSPDGKSLASASADKTARIWDMETLAPLHILRSHDAALQTIAFHPDGHLLATAGGDQIITLWHPQEGTILRTLRGPTSWIRDLTFSADGRLLVCASADNHIYVWDVETGALRTTLTGHSSGVDCVALSPDGKTLASGGEDSTVLLWDLATGEIIARLMNHASAVRTVVFSPDGRSLATGGDDRTIRLWDVETAESYFVLLGHSNWVLSLAFTQDGEMLISGGEDQTIRAWNTATGEQRNSTQGYTNWVYCIDLSPDGRTLLSGNGDHLIRLWAAAARSMSIFVTYAQGLKTIPPTHVGLLQCAGPATS